MDRQHRFAAVDDHSILTIPDGFCLTSVIANDMAVSIVRLLDCNTPGRTWVRRCSLPTFAVISHRSTRAQRISTPLDLPKIDREIVLMIPKIS